MYFSAIAFSVGLFMKHPRLLQRIHIPSPNSWYLKLVSAISPAIHANITLPALASQFSFVCTFISLIDGFLFYKNVKQICVIFSKILHFCNL